MASSSHIAPGETGKITATVETKGKVGTMVKHIRVESNDMQNPQMLLTLRMYVIPPPPPPPPPPVK